MIRLKGRFKFQMEVVAAEEGVVVGRWADYSENSVWWVHVS